MFPSRYLFFYNLGKQFVSRFLKILTWEKQSANPARMYHV